MMILVETPVDGTHLVTFSIMLMILLWNLGKLLGRSEAYRQAQFRRGYRYAAQSLRDRTRTPYDLDAEATRADHHAQYRAGILEAIDDSISARLVEDNRLFTGD